MLLRREDRLPASQRLLRLADERSEGTPLADLGELAEEEPGKLEGLLVPAEALKMGREPVEWAEVVAAAGPGRLQEVEQAAGPVRVVGGHRPQSDPDTGFR